MVYQLVQNKVVLIMFHKVIHLTILFMIVKISFTVKTRYIHAERPVITYFSDEFFGELNVTAKRYGRHNPVYYFSFGFTSKLTLGNNVSISMIFYEARGSAYKRSFVELHYLLCNIIDNPFCGKALKKQLELMGAPAACPFKPGTYYFKNMTVLPGSIPEGAPFTKGRIYLNTTFVPRKKVILTGHVDLELKVAEIHGQHWFE